MPYSAEISRTNPTAILFLLDQSSSMLEPFGGQPDRRKADGVADARRKTWRRCCPPPSRTAPSSPGSRSYVIATVCETTT